MNISKKANGYVKKTFLNKFHPVRKFNHVVKTMIQLLKAIKQNSEVKCGAIFAKHMNKFSMKSTSL
jgi:hypothetical protein